MEDGQTATRVCKMLPGPYEPLRIMTARCWWFPSSAAPDHEDGEEP